MKTTVIQTGSLGAIPDTYIDSSNATTNFGTSGTVRIHRPAGGSPIYRAILQFQTQALQALKGRRIANAKLEVYATALGSNVSGTIEIRQILKNNAETQATWNLAQTGVNWKIAGAGSGTSLQTETTTSAQADIYQKSGDLISNFVYSVPALPAFITLIDQDPVFTEYVQELTHGLWSQNRGILLRPTSFGTVTLIFRSSDHATASTRPKLTIEHRAMGEMFVGHGLGR